MRAEEWWWRSPLISRGPVSRLLQIKQNKKKRVAESLMLTKHPHDCPGASPRARSRRIAYIAQTRLQLIYWTIWSYEKCFCVRIKTNSDLGLNASKTSSSMFQKPLIKSKKKITMSVHKVSLSFSVRYAIYFKRKENRLPICAY